MFRPGHGETNRSALLKEVVVGTLCLFVLAAAIVSTVSDVFNPSFFARILNPANHNADFHHYTLCNVGYLLP